MHSWRPLPALVASAALLLLACSHGEPFGPVDHSSGGPFEPGITPLRLTYGGGRSPAWMPDGASFIYSFESSDHSNGAAPSDTCLGILPASGGQRTASICSDSPLEAETLDVYTQPTPAPDGDRVAFLRGLLDPVTGSGLTSLMVGALDSLPAGTVLGNNRFPGAHGQVLGIGSLHWLDADQLVFLGEDNGTFSPCASCDPIVISRWRDAYRRSVTGTTEAIPGSDFATSVAVASPTELYLTFANDGRVVRHDVNSGAEAVVATFDAIKAPRDADYANGRIALVAGGVISQLVDDDGQPMQGMDQGGELQIVNATTGAVTPLHNATLLFRRPRWSPDGTSLLAEGYPYQVVTVVPPGGINTFPDTVVSGVSDIYRIQVP
ncbi:MAG TPA: hypothetical protein VFM12_07935 [Gemmatimonadales bacterium]|jgi:hypothetical protein|nr:hypothetical protein [Gemmatimonadales bacterium]